jgi:hypothetical protein
MKSISSLFAAHLAQIWRAFHWRHVGCQISKEKPRIHPRFAVKMLREAARNGRNADDFAAEDA